LDSGRRRELKKERAALFGLVFIIVGPTGDSEHGESGDEEERQVTNFHR
jgi:hypothetical protein